MPIFAENCADQMTINFALNTFEVTNARQPSKFALSADILFFPENCAAQMTIDLAADAFEATKARHR
jgi:hypothetical protein